MGGAWPFLVGGVICLVNSVNERDLSLLNSTALFLGSRLLRGTIKRKSSACVEYVPGPCTHRPSLLPIEWSGEARDYDSLTVRRLSVVGSSLNLSFRGRRSRNKVSVGEPAEGSLKIIQPTL
ncbi:unnamed protein product [Bathycoccus prasinos]